LEMAAAAAQKGAGRKEGARKECDRWWEGERDGIRHRGGGRGEPSEGVRGAPAECGRSPVGVIFIQEEWRLAG